MNTYVIGILFLVVFVLVAIVYKLSSEEAARLYELSSSHSKLLTGRAEGAKTMALNVVALGLELDKLKEQLALERRKLATLESAFGWQLDRADTITIARIPSSQLGAKQKGMLLVPFLEETLTIKSVPKE